MKKEQLILIATKLEIFLELSEKYRKAEFFNPNTYDRENKQRLMDSDNFGDFRFKYRNDEYFLSSYLRINSKSFHFSKLVLRNDKKSNTRVLKKILEEIKIELVKI